MTLISLTIQSQDFTVCPELVESKWKHWDGASSDFVNSPEEKKARCSDCAANPAEAECCKYHVDNSRFTVRLHIFPCVSVSCCDSLEVVAGTSTSLSAFFTGIFTADAALTPADASATVYKREDGATCLWLVESTKNWAIGDCSAVGQDSAYALK